MVSREVYMKNISKLIDHELIKVITGIRRCGKSHMLKWITDELIRRGIDKENIILIDFDNPEYNSIENTRELDLFIEEQVKNIKGKIYFLFDEIQNVDGWERSLAGYKIQYDCDIYITSSNADLLSGDLATHLTGRYIRIKMYPFSYKEFLEHENQGFDEYLKYGGIPVVLKLPEDYKLEYLNDLFNSIFTEDILKRYSVKYELLLRVFIFILENIGNDLSAKDIGEHLKISEKTVYKYLKYLEEACLIYKAEYDVLGNETLKYYATDHGFCHAMLQDNQKNIAKILENIVFIELLRREYDVKVVDESEVIFICIKANKIIYIQFKYFLNPDKNEFESLLAIPDNYPKYVISTDKFDLSHSGIIHLNIIDFLNDYSLIK